MQKHLMRVSIHWISSTEATSLCYGRLDVASEQKGTTSHGSKLALFNTVKQAAKHLRKMYYMEKQDELGIEVERLQVVSAILGRQILKIQTMQLKED